MTAEQIKAALLQYYRYDRQYRLCALESYHWHNADVVCVTGRGHIIETEVKVSIADMKVDLNKPKHGSLRERYLNDHPEQASLLHPREQGWRGTYKYSGHHFYFAVPESIAEDASHVRNTYYPYAGLILVRPEPYMYSLSMFGIRIASDAYYFVNPKADIKILSALVKDQSATLTRLAVDNCRLRGLIPGAK